MTTLTKAEALLDRIVEEARLAREALWHEDYYAVVKLLDQIAIHLTVTDRLTCCLARARHRRERIGFGKKHN